MIIRFFHPSNRLNQCVWRLPDALKLSTVERIFALQRNLGRTEFEFINSNRTPAEELAERGE